MPQPCYHSGAYHLLDVAALWCKPPCLSDPLAAVSLWDAAVESTCPCTTQHAAAYAIRAQLFSSSLLQHKTTSPSPAVTCAHSPVSLPVNALAVPVVAELSYPGPIVLRTHSPDSPLGPCHACEVQLVRLRNPTWAAAGRHQHARSSSQAERQGQSAVYLSVPHIIHCLLFSYSRPRPWQLTSAAAKAGISSWRTANCRFSNSRPVGTQRWTDDGCMRSEESNISEQQQQCAGEAASGLQRAPVCSRTVLCSSAGSLCARARSSLHSLRELIARASFSSNTSPRRSSCLGIFCLLTLSSCWLSPSMSAQRLKATRGSGLVRVSASLSARTRRVAA